jgi:unsaturated rhamnogalacturonyl hydrolase
MKKKNLKMKQLTCLYLGFALSTILLMPIVTFSQKITSGKSVMQVFSPDSIFRLMKKAADWQLDSIRKNGWSHSERDWTNAAMYTGLLKFAELANDKSYYDFLIENVAQKNNWMLQTDSKRYHADYYCVGQTYCRLYQIYKDPKMIADLENLADSLIVRPHVESLEFAGNTKNREWNWCDALFMGPPSLAMLANVTGDRKYMDICDKLWWRTAEYLYDKNAHLFYRDSQYFTLKEKNGEKVFWSRGNGWVMGGLIRVLENMPADYPTRERWINLYREMAGALLKLQQPDGSWHASLLDPLDFPVKETSGTGFICYALAWGINHGILETKQYLPGVWKAWQALAGCVHPDGKLGYVQQIGAAPGAATYDGTEVYGVGAFLLASSEVIKMSIKSSKNKSALNVTNKEAAPQTVGDLLNQVYKAGKRNKNYQNVLTGETLTVSSEVPAGTTLYLKTL